MYQGPIYHSKIEYSDAEVASKYGFPVMFFIRNNNKEIIKQITYESDGTKSVVNFTGNSVGDFVLTMGEISCTHYSVNVALHSSGANAVKINGTTYYRYSVSNFNYTQVTGSNLKSLIIYALPTAEMLYLAEGAEGLEAVEPELPAGALFVRKITVAHNNQYVDADSLVGYREKAVDGWKLHIASSSASAYLILDGSKKANFSVVRLSSASEVNLAGVNGKNIGWIYDGLEITISNDTGTDINLLDTPASGQAKKFILPTSPFILKDGKSLKCYYSADQNAIVPLIIGGGGDVTFATQSEMENQTPPSAENSKAVSLFGLWKWLQKAVKYIYLQPSTANTVPNKDWSDGTYRYFTNSSGVNNKMALIDSVSTVDKLTLLTPQGTIKPISTVPLSNLTKVYGEDATGATIYSEAVEAKKVNTSNTAPTILELIEQGVDRIDYPNLGRIYFNYGTKWGYITLTEVV